MSRDDGFPTADVNTHLLEDPKVVALARLLRDPMSTMAHVGVFVAVLLKSWDAGHRVSIDEALPGWWLESSDEVRANLTVVRLLDDAGMVQEHAWQSWAGKATERKLRRVFEGTVGGLMTTLGMSKPDAEVEARRRLGLTPVQGYSEAPQGSPEPPSTRPAPPRPGPTETPNPTGGEPRRSPRANRTNPRALGTNPRAVAERQAKQRKAAAQKVRLRYYAGELSETEANAQIAALFSEPTGATELVSMHPSPALAPPPGLSPKDGQLPGDGSDTVAATQPPDGPPVPEATRPGSTGTVHRTTPPPRRNP